MSERLRPAGWALALWLAFPLLAHADSRVRVQLVSPNQTTLSAEIAARLVELPFREGQAFKAGQILAGFDCVLFTAQRDKAEAQEELARQSLETARKLHERGMSSDLEWHQAQSKLKETAADAQAARATASRCTIVAPFDGRVARLAVAQYQFVTAGTPLMEIVDTRKLEVQAVVPSNWLAWLREGDTFSLRVDELGRAYRARVARLAARIDAVSQMAPLVGEIENPSPELLPGMSGWATFRARR
jgi:membrane fusion protein (multidrug efflux system)